MTIIRISTRRVSFDHGVQLVPSKLVFMHRAQVKFLLPGKGRVNEIASQCLRGVFLARKISFCKNDKPAAWQGVSLKVVSVDDVLVDELHLLQRTHATGHHWGPRFYNMS